MKRALFALAGAALLAAVLPAIAQVPAEADDFKVTPAAGSWMIILTTFKGDAASELARGLCVEVRQRHRIPAYTFDRTEEARRKRDEEAERRRREIIKNLEASGLPMPETEPAKCIVIARQSKAAIGYET